MSTAGSSDPHQSETHTAASKQEQQTVRALSEGDHKAYDTLFLKYYDRSIGFVRSLVSREDDAEDIVEDVFVWLWTHREQLDATKNFQSFLYTKVRNAVFDHFRHRKVRHNYLNQLPDTNLNTAGPTDEEFMARETELLISLTVSRMPEQRRKVFELNHHQGMSNAEIAEQLGVSRKAVEKHMRLALSDIRKVVTAFLAFFCLS